MRWNLKRLLVVAGLFAALMKFGSCVHDSFSEPEEEPMQSTPACGNCSWNKNNGLLTCKLQRRFAHEPATPWNAMEVVVEYATGSPSRHPVTSSRSVNPDCNTTKIFTTNLAGLRTASIRAISVNLQPQSGGAYFMRRCVKLATDGNDVVLERGCDCNCSACTDVQ